MDRASPSERSLTSPPEALAIPPRRSEPPTQTRARSGTREWATRLRSATARDLAWAVFVALLLAASPITGAKRVVPALVLGALGSAALLADRLRRRAREGPQPPRSAIAMPAAPVWAVGLCALVAHAPTLAWLYERYTESIWRNPHGLFVALFAVLLARRRLRRDPDPGPESSAWGFALLAPGCVLGVLDAGVRSHYLGLLGMLFSLWGLSLLLLGGRRTRRIAFPLAFCLFLTPLPDGLHDPLSLPSVTSEIGAAIVRAVGLPVLRFGTRLELANGLVIEVSQNCSGLSSFYSSSALAVLCLAVTRSWPRRVALCAAPYLLTALANGVRVALLLTVGFNVGMQWKYSTPIHGLIGTSFFLAVMLGVWLLSDRRALREALS